MGLAVMPSELDNPNDTQKAREYIIARTCYYWQSHRRPLILSNLGEHFEKDEPELYDALIRPTKLRTFIKTMVPEVRVIPHTTTKNKIGLVPSETDVPADTDLLFSAPSRPARTLYHSEFWNAFSKPLGYGCARYVDVDIKSRSFHVQDVYVDESFRAPPSWHKVDNDLLVGPEIEPGIVRSDLVIDNISKWLAEHSLPEDLFVRKQERRQRDDLVALLLALDKALPVQHAARILVPLDVIVSAIKRDT